MKVLHQRERSLQELMQGAIGSLGAALLASQHCIEASSAALH